MIYLIKLNSCSDGCLDIYSNNGHDIPFYESNSGVTLWYICKGMQMKYLFVYAPG